MDGDGIIRAGNASLKGAKAAGVKKVRIVKGSRDELVVVQRDDIKGDDATAYAILDNRTSEMGEWNTPVLDLQIADLGGYTLEDLGFSIESTDATRIRQLPTKPLPTMSWVLIGIPTVRFAEISAQIENLANVDGIFLETSCNG